jgi:hypothetical protein
VADRVEHLCRIAADALRSAAYISVVDLSVTATRQNAGRREKICATREPVGGAVGPDPRNPPAGTLGPNVIDALGSDNGDNDSHHDCGVTVAPGATANDANATAKRITKRSLSLGNPNLRAA